MNNKIGAIDLANYIIWKAIDFHKVGITNLKLQKLIYFTYAQHLVATKRKIFDEPIEKWQYGPVVPSVYHAFKDYGVYEINQTKSKFSIDLSTGKPVLKTENFDPTAIIFNDYIKLDVVNSEISKLIHKDAYELVEETHRHPMWAKYKDRIMSGERNIQYSDQELLDYFNPQNLNLYFLTK